MKLQSILIIFILFSFFGLQSCTSCSSDADSNKIAEDLADRMTDSLDFDGGEIVESDLPEGNDSAEYPQIESIDEVSEIEMGQDFYFNLASNYANFAEIAFVIVHVQNSTKYIKVPANLVNQLVTLFGNMKIDEKLNGEDFTLFFALQTTDNKTGSYKPLGVKVSETTISRKLNLDDLDGSLKDSNGNSIDLIKSQPPEGTTSADSPQITEINIPSPISLNDPVEISISSNFEREITSAILTMPNTEAYFELENQNTNDEPVFKTTIYFSDTIIDALATAKMKSGFKAEKISVTVTFLWALRYKNQTGLYRATKITLIGSSQTDPGDGDIDDEEEERETEESTEEDGDIEEELEQEEEIIKTCDCVCDLSGGHFEFETTTDMLNNSGWTEINDRGANYDASIEKNPADGENEGGNALKLTKKENIEDPLYVNSFGECTSCEISFWVSTPQCPSENNAQNNVNVLGTDLNGEQHELFKFAIRGIVTDTQQYVPYLALAQSNGDYIKLKECGEDNNIYKLHFIPDWNNKTLTVYVDGEAFPDSISFYDKNIPNVTTVEIYHESTGLTGYFDEFEFLEECQVDGDADYEDETDDESTTSSACMSCTSNEECGDGYLCLKEKNFCVRRSSYITETAIDCPDGFDAQTENVYDYADYQEVCYPSTSQFLTCQSGEVYAQDNCGNLMASSLYPCADGSECSDDSLYCKETNCDDKINNNENVDEDTEYFDCKENDCFYSATNTNNLCEQCRPCFLTNDDCGTGYKCIPSITSQYNYCAYIKPVDQICPENTAVTDYEGTQVCQNSTIRNFCSGSTYSSEDSCGFVTQEMVCGTGTTCEDGVGCIESDCTNDKDDDNNSYTNCEDPACETDPACTSQCLTCPLGSTTDCPTGYSCLDDGSGTKSVCLKNCTNDEKCPSGSICKYIDANKYCTPDIKYYCDTNQILWVATACDTEVIKQDCSESSQICTDSTIWEHAHCVSISP